MCEITLIDTICKLKKKTNYYTNWYLRKSIEKEKTKCIRTAWI